MGAILRAWNLKMDLAGATEINKFVITTFDRVIALLSTGLLIVFNRFP